MKLNIVKEKFAEAEDKLKSYQTTLQQTYNNTLRLHTFSVVSLGYDRLLWQKL